LPRITKGARVFAGLAVEGGDAEYILIASGKLTQRRQPSLVREQYDEYKLKSALLNFWSRLLFLM